MRGEQGKMDGARQTPHDETGDELARLRAAARLYEARSDILAELGGDYTYAFRLAPTGEARDHASVTDGFTRLTGFTEAEMERRGWETLAHPDDRAALRERGAFLAAGQTFRHEYRILTKGGDVCWIEDAARATPPDDAGDVWIYGVVRDITARKRAEATGQRLVAQVRAAGREADEERERMRDLLAQIPAAIAVYSGPEHIAEFVNPAYERLLGRTAAQAVGKRVRETFAEMPSDAPVFALLDQTYATGAPTALPALPVRYDRDGDGQIEEAFYDTLYHPLRNAAGQMRGVLVHAVEVTEQVRADRRSEELADAVRIERDRLQQVLDVLPEAVLIADTTPTFIIGNRAAADLLGVEAVGHPVPLAGNAAYDAYGAAYLDGTPYPADQLPLERALLGGETVRGDQFFLRNAITGTQIPVLANAAPLRDTQGAITGGVVGFQDIGAIWELERTQEEFVSTASHDLKGPLTSVRGYTQLAARRLGKLKGLTGEDTAPLAAALTSIETATARMLGIINELSDVTRVRMGVPLELHRESIDLVALVRGVVEQQAFAAHPIRVAAVTPELVGEVDAPRFERVLTNLLTNAIKYSPDDTPITVRIGREETESGPIAAIAVADRGMGIPAADLPTIFDRYTRARNVTGRIAGSGIGLTSVRDIVTRHGGTVQIESTVGGGSTFTVRVPLHPPDDAR